MLCELCLFYQCYNWRVDYSPHLPMKPNQSKLFLSGIMDVTEEYCIINGDYKWISREEQAPQTPQNLYIIGKGRCLQVNIMQTDHPKSLINDWSIMSIFWSLLTWVVICYRWYRWSLWGAIEEEEMDLTLETILLVLICPCWC